MFKNNDKVNYIKDVICGGRSHEHSFTSFYNYFQKQKGVILLNRRAYYNNVGVDCKISNNIHADSVKPFIEIKNIAIFHEMDGLINWVYGCLKKAYEEGRILETDSIGFYVTDGSELYVTCNFKNEIVYYDAKVLPLNPDYSSRDEIYGDTFAWRADDYIEII